MTKRDIEYESHPRRNLPAEEGLPLIERFPRKMLFEFTDDHTNSSIPKASIRLLEAEPNAFPGGPIDYYRNVKPRAVARGYKSIH